MLDKSKINKILVVSLTNIGDVILTFPAIDILKNDFPNAELSVVIGPKAESLFAGNSYFKHIYIFNKHQAPLKSFAWIMDMRKERFDLVVDLRNTAIPFMLCARYRTSCRVEKDAALHMKEKHLRQLRSIYSFQTVSDRRYALSVSRNDERCVDELIHKRIGRQGGYVVVAPGAADSAKRWSREGFASVCDRLIKEYHLKVVFVGDETDWKVAQEVNRLMESDGVNLCGQTSLVQLAELFKRCFFALVNDSAPMHLASYLNVPVLALFGPTDPLKYGPWSSKSIFIQKNKSCDACAHPKDSLAHTCMASITADDVLNVLDIDQSHSKINFIGL